ncbi:MAG: MoxR family ATPase [Gammaproteobacteria bacterium]
MLSKIDELKNALCRGFVGKSDLVDLLLVCHFCDGHILIEDVPGLGKTTLVRTLAKSIGGTSNRIQFTPDILPGDITGVSIFNQAINDFEFHFGPIFSNFVLADEINRASPRTQSALLEVMAERTVTVDGVSHKVPRPFLVVATQNPIEMDGTYPLPEAQLDRFMMRVSIGYPSAESEIEILRDEHEGRSIDDIQPVISLKDIAEISKIAKQTYVAPSIFDYITRITNATRVAEDVTLGCSPRASLALLKASRVRAMMQGRNHVLPSDIQELAVPICAHRLILKSAHQSTRSSVDDVIRRIVQEVEVPHGEFAE